MTGFGIIKKPKSISDIKGKRLQITKSGTGEIKIHDILTGFEIIKKPKGEVLLRQIKTGIEISTKDKIKPKNKASEIFKLKPLEPKKANELLPQSTTTRGLILLQKLEAPKVQLLSKQKGLTLKQRGRIQAQKLEDVLKLDTQILKRLREEVILDEILRTKLEAKLTIPKLKLNQVQLLKLDTVQQQKLDQIQLLKLDTIQQQKLDQIQLLKLDQIQLLKLDQIQLLKLDQIQLLKLDTVQQQKLDTIQLLKLDTIQQQKLDQVQLLKLGTMQQQKLRTDQLLKQDTGQLLKIPELKIPRLGDPPDIILSEGKKKIPKKETTEKGYDVFVKDQLTKFQRQRKFKAREIRVNREPQTLRGAQGLGAYVADNTTAQTFRVKPTTLKHKTVTRENEFRTFLLNKFRQKRVKGVRQPIGQPFVEKQIHAIDTYGEFQGITAKAWIARRKIKPFTFNKSKFRFKKLKSFLNFPKI